MMDDGEVQYGNLSEAPEDGEELYFLNAGRERFNSNKRQLGGLCLVLGTCAAFQPLATIASLIGLEDENTTNAGLSRIETVTLISALLQFLLGSLAMVVGYLNLVHDYGHYLLTGSLIMFTQLAWLPFITGMVLVGQAASAPFTFDTQRTVINGTVLLEEFIVNPFIPSAYLPTQLDVQFFGAMGILGIMAYGTGFLGSLAFTEFALYAFDAGQPTHRDAMYFRGRLAFYSFILALAGVSQLLLGSYILFVYGGGPLSPAVGVAMYQIYFPEISVAIGSTQIVVGYIGIARYLNYLPIGATDHEMQFASFLGWFLQLVLQYIAQISYGDGDENAAALPSLAMLSLGMNLMPAYLDYKMRTTPQYLTNEYYGISVKESKHMLNVDYTHLGSSKMIPPEDVERPHDLKDWSIEMQEDPVEVGEKSLLMPPVPTDTEENGITEPLEQSIQFEPIKDLNDSQAQEEDMLRPAEENYQFEVGAVGAERDPGKSQQLIPADEPSPDELVTEDEYEDLIEGRNQRSMEPPEQQEERTTNIDEEEDGVIILEEYIEYPDDFDSDDRDLDDSTPPQSNKSSESGQGIVEDTWETSLTPPERLSPLEEEDSERILAEDQDSETPVTPANEATSTAGTSEDGNNKRDHMPTSARSLVSEYSMDYSTPSDDSVALETKIKRLQKELHSDTDMESYLNNIL